MTTDDSSPAISVSDNKAPKVQPALITAAELAQMMQVSVRTLWRLLSAGQIPAPIRIGGNTRWRVEEINQWIAEGCPQPACAK